METNIIYNEDCVSGMNRIPDNSIDIVCTDPPYLYLKNQKLDREFDERSFFNQVKRILKKDGFIILFGRGTSFYRWNTMLADLGFTFKEEVIWDKIRTTSPLLNLSRKHETISIFTKGKGIINKCKIPFDEIFKYNDNGIGQTAKRVISYIRNQEFDALLDICKNGKLCYDKKETHKTHVTCNFGFHGCDRGLSSVNAIIRGSKERDIIQIQHNHYSAIHPTQKPVRLLERLLNLVCEDNAIVIDPFSGSASTAVACLNTNRQYIGFEIDKDYYDLSIERIKNLHHN